jgi:mRNA interferase RelE/StbE
MIPPREVVYARAAIKVLDRMPANEAQRLREKVRQYADDPQSLANNVKALSGSPYIRLPVGDWRVIMDDRSRVLAVLRVGPRGGIYE